MKLPIVSIIGRPNVGKSTLFNRIARRRIAVVDDMPGVTRDRNYVEVNWNGIQMILVDTGGLQPQSKEAMAQAINSQVEIAVAESNAVLLLGDAGTGPTDIDEVIARKLRKTAKEKAIVAVNKSESKKIRLESQDFAKLGLGDPIPISALHGFGVADLLDRIAKVVKENSPQGQSSNPDNIALKLAVVGRPNAGKSSMVNKILGQDRMIVDNKPGTTRDSIDSEMRYHGKSVIIIDTAGLRKKSHVKEDLEYYSNLRAMTSIERCDVAVLVIDVTQGIGVQDLRILKKIQELRKGVLIAWNKWDIQEKDHKTFDQLVAQTRSQFMEIGPIPMVAVSALTNQRLTKVLDMAFEVKERLGFKVPAAEFEDNVFSWVRTHPHPAIPHNPVRFLGARQTGAPFPLFKFFVTNPDEMAPGYVRYLTNKIYETYDFSGCPLVLEFKKIARSHRKHSAQPEAEKANPEQA